MKDAPGRPRSMGWERLSHLGSQPAYGVRAGEMSRGVCSGVDDQRLSGSRDDIEQRTARGALDGHSRRLPGSALVKRVLMIAKL